MLQNYITTFLRILSRQKVYSFINVFGLALGIGATLLITLYIQDELSYDRFHQDADRIYRLGWLTKFSGVERKGWQIGTPTGLALQREVAAVESIVRMERWYATPVEYKEHHFTEKEILFADSNFFSFFSFKLVTGSPGEVLQGPNKIVLTESAAKKYFGYRGRGDIAPIGKTLLVGSEKKPMMVTGIAFDPPPNSHFHFMMVASSSTIPIYRQTESGWWGIRTYTYFKIYQNADIHSVEAQFPNFYKILLDKSKDWFVDSWETAKKNGNEVEYFVQPLTEIHLGSNLQYEFEPNGEKIYIELLYYITLFIVLLACINYVNLATARAANRAKEIGIRKTSGALKSKLVNQFIMESMMYAAISMLVALAMTSLAIGPFNLLTGKNLQITSLYSLAMVVKLVFLMAGIGLVSGIYPAFVISSVRPVEVLKGKIHHIRHFNMRNKLVTFQFMISSSLIIVTLIIYQQIQFLKTKDAGFNTEHVLILPNTSSLGKNKDAFRNELISHAEFTDASFSNRLPPQIEQISGYQKKGESSFHWVYSYMADYHHANTLGLQMKEGRFFSTAFPSDTLGMVINESAAKIFGIYDLKQKQYVGFPPNWYPEVIGIVKDFNFESLKNSVGPMIIFYGGQSKMSIRVAPGDVTGKIELLGKLWKKYSDANFEYAFMDERMAGLYASEEQFGTITILFSTLAILIASLGLLGLVTYVASQRTREIGIRKVLGASVQQIVILLSRDFVRLVCVAMIFALPLSWYAMEQWLNGFANRIEFKMTVPLIACAVVFFVAIITVSFQSIQAALSNPTESLRSD